MEYRSQVAIAIKNNKKSPEFETLLKNSEIVEHLNLLQSKIDSGRFRYAEVQKRDRLLNEYFKLENETCRRCRNLRNVDNKTTCFKCRNEME